jgi:predicted ATP-dependent serine protease
MTISHEESVRLHIDWYGKCRTCKFWNGASEPFKTSSRVHLRWNPSKCENSQSPLFDQVTHTGGHCEKWETFDTPGAEEALRDDPHRKKR